MNAVGKNTIAGTELRTIIERVEGIDAQKKQLGKERAAILAEAKSRGFVPEAIRYCVKVRAMKPHDRQEADALRDMYLHSIGLDQEPPLFRAVGLMDIDINAREQVIDAMRKFVPTDGEIIVKVGGVAERIWRDKDGEVHNEPVVEKPAREPIDTSRRPTAEKPAPPNVDEAGAEQLGRAAAKDNRPVIDNPFPFGDPRRARFDEGWRKEAGGDGMGPDEAE